MLHELRRGQRGEIANRRLFVPDFDALAQVAAFDARYLHGGEAEQLPARASALFDKDEPTGVRPSPLGAPPSSSYRRRSEEGRGGEGWDSQCRHWCSTYYTNKIYNTSHDLVANTIHKD